MIDVDDLWEKQLKYGTAVEGKKDTMEDVFKIADEYCMKFQTVSGKREYLNQVKELNIYLINHFMR